VRIAAILAAAVAAVVLLPTAASGHSASPTVKVGCDETALQTAVTNANTAGSGTIKLAAHCVYAISTPATATDAFVQITGNVTIIGADSTTIDRAPNAAAFRFFNVASGGTLTLRTMTIHNGSTTGLGGGVLNAGTLNVQKVTFVNNVAANGGGISNSAGGTATVTNATFAFNITTGVGGGGVINFGQLTISKSDFDSNTAPVNGGGLNTQPGGVTTIVGSMVEKNTSAGLGGGISNLGATNVTNSSVRDNTASSGGGIATGNTNVVLKKAKVIDNHPDNCSPSNTIEGCNG